MAGQAGSLCAGRPNTLISVGSQVSRYSSSRWDTHDISQREGAAACQPLIRVLGQAVGGRDGPW